MSGKTFASLTWEKSSVFAPLRVGTFELAFPGALGDAPNDFETWVVFAQEDALAMPGFERLLSVTATTRQDVQLFYADDVALGVQGPERVRLKPAFNLALLQAEDSIGAPLMIRASALKKLGGVRAEFGGACLYDLTLRAAANGMGIERIPHVMLAYPNQRPAAPKGDRRRAVEDWVGLGPYRVADGLTATSLELQRRFDDFPEVTIVTPTRQSGPGKGEPYVVELLDSLASLEWPMDRLTVIVGDDSDRGETFDNARWPFAVRRIATPRPADQPFSFAAKMNRLWPQATSEHIVLLNDDVRVTSPGWLKALMTFAMQPDVGGVGGRLLFPDGRLQHAGMAGGLFGGVTHLWAGSPADQPTYQDWAVLHREWSAVTGAVFATRRSVLEAAAGFDERFSLEYNDVDLCFRLRLMGYRIVYTPFAEGVHREMASRGYTPPDPEQTALFLSRWRAMLADDPAYHPGLTRKSGSATPTGEPDWYDRL